MTKLTIEIDNEDDKNLILQLLNRLGTKYKEEHEIDNELISIIVRGGDGKSITDPVLWQRKAREDRELPFKK